MQKGSSFITNPELFGCYLVMNLNDPISLNSALRYWGCAVQAGALVSGAFGIAHSGYDQGHVDTAKVTFSPLPFASFTPIPFTSPLNWGDIMRNGHFKNAHDLLSASKSGSNEHKQLVTFDPVNKSVTLFMPGFDKSEIKLYQVSQCKICVFFFSDYCVDFKVKLCLFDFEYQNLQYRGGSELLIEAGDQRRVVFLPSNIQGKFGGAKFIDRKLIITMRS